MGIFFYWGHRQDENALAEFDRALEFQPNNAWRGNFAPTFTAGAVNGSVHWQSFNERRNSTRAMHGIPGGIGSTYENLRLWKDAERAELRAFAIDPHNSWQRWIVSALASRDGRH